MNFCCLILSYYRSYLFDSFREKSTDLCSPAVMTTEEIGQFPRRKGANAAIFFIETSRQFRGKLIVAPESGQWNRTHIAVGYLIGIHALWITGSRDFTNYNDNTWHLNTTCILSTCLQPACVFTFTKVQHFFGAGLGPFPLFLSTQILDALTRPRFPGCHGGVSQCDVMWRYFLRNEILTCFFPHISFFGKLGTGFVTESFNVDKPQQGSSPAAECRKWSRRPWICQGYNSSRQQTKT